MDHISHRGPANLRLALAAIAQKQADQPGKRRDLYGIAIDLPSRRDAINPACSRCDRWKDSFGDAAPSFSPKAPAAIPSGPTTTRKRMICNRCSCESAANAMTARPATNLSTSQDLLRY